MAIGPQENAKNLVRALGHAAAAASSSDQRESTVTALHPPNRVELTSTASGVTAAYDYRLRGIDGHTEITLDAACTATGWILPLHPLISYVMKRVDSKQLAALKRVAESKAETAHLP